MLTEKSRRFGQAMRAVTLSAPLLLAFSGLGAVLATPLYRIAGLRGALIVIGALLPLAALAARRSLAAIDAAAEVPAHRLGLLRGVRFLALLPPPALELLASRAVEVHVPAGEDVVREGDRGDSFYVIDSGEVEIAGGRHGRGAYFGEIALLRDVPRTATVHAVTKLDLLVLERDDFLAAVTGYAPSAEAANVVIAARVPALSG